MDGWNTILSFEKGLQGVFHEPSTAATFLAIYHIHYFLGHHHWEEFNPVGLG